MSCLSEPSRMTDSALLQAFAGDLLSTFEGLTPDVSSSSAGAFCEPKLLKKGHAIVDLTYEPKKVKEFGGLQEIMFFISDWATTQPSILSRWRFHEIKAEKRGETTFFRLCLKPLDTPPTAVSTQQSHALLGTNPDAEMLNIFMNLINDHIKTQGGAPLSGLTWDRVTGNASSQYTLRIPCEAPLAICLILEPVPEQIAGCEGWKCMITTLENAVLVTVTHQQPNAPVPPALENLSQAAFETLPKFQMPLFCPTTLPLPPIEPGPVTHKFPPGIFFTLREYSLSPVSQQRGPTPVTDWSSTEDRMISLCTESLPEWILSVQQKALNNCGLNVQFVKDQETYRAFIPVENQESLKGVLQTSCNEGHSWTFQKYAEDERMCIVIITVRSISASTYEQ